MEVRLNPLYGMSNTALGPVETLCADVWRVDVYDEALTGPPMEIASGKLHVGMIGRQPGANFCENDNFRLFSPEQKAQILADVRTLHGSASGQPPVELTAPVEFEDDELDDTDVIDD